MRKTSVGVLGATGMVGQRFIQLLSGHPNFELKELTASKKSAGEKYEKVAKWYLDTDMPSEVKDKEVKETSVESVEDVDIVFSALPSSAADKVEPEMAEAGKIVASNASSYRMEPDVPLMIPEINPDHLNLIEEQRENRGWSGAIVTNPNCSTIILLLALKPIMDEYGINRVFVCTMQAVSGAGYSGVKSMEILDNMIPYISKEEWKTENEPLKILGTYSNGEVDSADIEVSASCNRIPVLDGHTESVFLELEESASPTDVKKTLGEFEGEPQKLDLQTAPENPVIVTEEEDRPQPRFARDAGEVPGMSVVVGRVREDDVFNNGIRFLVSGNNIVRGAAGASILNAELMNAKNII
ncbi:MAG: aspartate-semialdehyde dehydrogenase [Candidatus Hadarchaeota archaeon]